MEQNLSERERKQRLAIGIGLFIAALIVFSVTNEIVIGLALMIGSAGFMANYFTCFCGLKKAIERLKI